MKTDIDKAIKSAKAILKDLENIKDAHEQAKMFEGDDKVTFVRFLRWSWDNRKKGARKHNEYGSWYQVIDSNSSRYVVKNRRGFEFLNIGKTEQTVDSTKATATMLFSPDDPSREVANTVLNQLAQEKYKMEEGDEQD